MSNGVSIKVANNPQGVVYPQCVHYIHSACSAFGCHSGFIDAPHCCDATIL